MIIKSIISVFSFIALFVAIIHISSFFTKRKVLRSLTFDPPNKKKGPLVSVVIPAFNEEKYLPIIITSLKHQSYGNIEIVVSDNASTDKTAEVARKMGAKVVYVPEKNLSIVRNRGAEAASGEILLFIDADSVVENYYVEKLMEKLSDKIVLTHGGICCSDSVAHGAWWTIARWLKPRIYIAGRNGICIKKKHFMEVGEYNPEKNPMEGYREDLDLGWRILKKYD